MNFATLNSLHFELNPFPMDFPMFFFFFQSFTTDWLFQNQLFHVHSFEMPVARGI